MEHDSRPRRADRMSQGDRSAVDVELRLIEAAQRVFEAQLGHAITVVGPRAEARNDLRGEGFVDLPGVDVAKLQAVSLEQRCRGVHRPQSHLRRIEAGPFAVDDRAQHR